MSRGLAGFVLAVTIAVLIGYACGITALIHILPSLQGMSILTASGLGALAITLCAPQHGVLRLAARGRFGFAIAALAFALTALVSHLVAAADVVSPWLAERLFDLPRAQSGLTSTATATGIATLALAQWQRLQQRALATDWLAALAFLISGTALLGYAYGVGDLYGVKIFNTIALHTAFCIFCLTLATVSADARTGWASIVASSRPGNYTILRQLIFTAVPPIAAACLLHEVRADDIGIAAAMAALVTITIVPLLALALHEGKTLDALYHSRQSADLLRGQISDDLAMRLAAQAVSLKNESDERAKAEATMYGAQRMEAVGQLTGGIAHDFNNLLMAIATNLHLAQSHIEDTHRARTYLDNAAKSADRGSSLTAQLMAFSRTQRLDIRPTELDAVLRQARELVGNALGPRIEIDLDLNTEACSVITDAAQLQLAIVNLALNARDAMPIGGTFTLRTANNVSEIINGQAIRYAAIYVSDTGCGMSPEVASRAVEPFYTTKERGKGTGLGLAQVYGVVKQCGGELRIQSEEGRGTTIEILLPFAEKAAAVTPLRARNTVSADQPLREQIACKILVIDDDELVRNATAELLRSAGYNVSEAENGASGLTLLSEIEPSVALIDFLMPGLNGAEVARLARIQRPTLPIIFISGYSDTVALDQIAGAVVLRKPVASTVLLAAVEQAANDAQINPSAAQQDAPSAAWSSAANARAHSPL